MSATVADTAPTVANILGTSVLLYPVPTPWPYSADCEKYIYRQVNDGTILAWDPVYPSLFSTQASTCYLPQQTSWWFQPGTTGIPVALGPTFACPQSYTAVHSTVLGSSPGTGTTAGPQTQYTYCCPPQFRQHALLPYDQRSVIQCTSTAAPGNTLSYITVSFATSTITITSSGNGDGGSVNTQTTVSLTSYATSTVIASSAATIYAPPVNGFNIISQSGGSSSNSSSGNTGGGKNNPTPQPGTSDQSSSDSSSVGMTSAAKGGIAAGVILVCAFCVLGIWLFWRRRKRQQESLTSLSHGNGMGMTGTGTRTGEDTMGVKYYYGSVPQPPEPQEMPAVSYTHELPSPTQQQERYELSGGGRREKGLIGLD